MNAELINPLKLLRELKGAPLSSLLALAIVRQPVNQCWIETVTGYDADTIRKGLRVLVEFGYAVKLRGQAWQIATSMQLPFFLEENTQKAEILGFSPTTTTDINILNNNNDVVVEEEQKAEKIGVLNQAVYELLKHAGVGNPALTELSNNPELDEKHVKAHIDKIRKERKSPALLIHRLRSGDMIVEDDDNEEDYRKYTKGQYGNIGLKQEEQ